MMLFNISTRAFTTWALACVTLMALKIGPAAQQILALRRSRHSYEREPLDWAQQTLGIQGPISKRRAERLYNHHFPERPVLKINNTAYAPEFSAILSLFLFDAQNFPFETPPYPTIEDTATST
ncbi:hypothetical protein SCAR479_08287 [Seiridium cardinale]|uniref:Uncharacterized protein n=1 Tax=Seiridium cardinale TaxID=138064 RepID=A0ABR2XMG8_9PEZI